MRLFLRGAVAAVFLAAGPASAALIDFEDFGHGDQVTSVSAGIFNATVTASGGIDQAWAFDTTLSGTDDPDLEGDFPHAGGTLADLNAGKALIIQTDNGNPDDHRFGGTITFVFDRVIDFFGFTLLDDATVTVASPEAGGVFVASQPAAEREYDVYTGAGGAPIFAGIRTLSFTFDGSGAIDRLQVEAVPVPAALPLLAGALGLLAAAARRRG